MFNVKLGPKIQHAKKYHVILEADSGMKRKLLFIIMDISQQQRNFLVPRCLDKRVPTVLRSFLKLTL